MQIDRSLKRERKQRKRRHGMRVTGRSVFIIQEIQIKKGQKGKSDAAISVR